MQEIIKVDSFETAKDNYKEFGYYANATRALASDIDGLKVSYRRMLWTAMQYPKGKMIKSAVISGECMKIHPHGEQSGVLYSLVNSKLNMFDKQGNFGSALIPGSAPRYTECRYNKMAELYLGQDLLNYCEMVEGDIGYMEPKYLPTLIPFILADGNSSMGIGISSSIPSYDILDLARFYRAGLTEEEEPTVKLDLGSCKVNITSKSMSDLAKRGKISGIRYSVKPIIEGKSIVINDIPPGMSFNKIYGVFNQAIEKDQVDYRDESNSTMRYVFDIVRGDKNQYLNSLKRLTSTESYDLVMTGSYTEDGNIVYSTLYDMRSKSLKYLVDCTKRKFNSEIKKLEKKLNVARVIKYMKDHGVVKDLPNLDKSELKKILPFDEYSVDNALQQNIGRLMKGVSDDEIVTMESELKVLNENLNNPNEYLIKLYDDFISAIEKSYENKTSYVDDIPEGSFDIVVKGKKFYVKDSKTQSSKSHAVLLYPTGWIRVVPINQEYTQDISEYVGMTTFNEDENLIVSCDGGQNGTVFSGKKLISMGEGYILTTKTACYIGVVGETSTLDNGVEIKTADFTYPKKSTPWGIYFRFEGCIVEEDKNFIRF